MKIIIHWGRLICFATLLSVYSQWTQASTITLSEFQWYSDIIGSSFPFFSMTFAPIPLAAGEGNLRFHARGDYNGEEHFSDEVIFWDMDNLYGTTYPDWISAGNIAGVTEGGSILNPHGLNDWEWEQSAIIPAADMVAATTDNFLTLNMYFHLVDNFYPTDFIEATLEYEAVDEPGPLYLLLAGLLGLVGWRTFRTIRPGGSVLSRMQHWHD